QRILPEDQCHRPSGRVQSADKGRGKVHRQNRRKRGGKRMEPLTNGFLELAHFCKPMPVRLPLTERKLSEYREQKQPDKHSIDCDKLWGPTGRSPGNDKQGMQR